MATDNDNRNAAVANEGAAPRFRIFLVSPGDVPHERKLAREAITHVGGERRFRGRIDIEIIAWDQPGAAVAMEAGLTPQEAIERAFRQPQPELPGQPEQQHRFSARQSAPLPRHALVGTGIRDAHGYPKRVSGCPWQHLRACQGDAAE